MSLFARLLGRQKPRWEEAWQTYPGTVDNASALWSVDLGAVDAAPLTQLPVRMDVEAPYAADADGLPADAGHLARMEDLVRQSVARLGGVYVGHLSGRGSCRFTGHLPSEPASPVTLPGLADARVRTEYDPHWAYVRDRLAPDERQHRLLSDRALVNVLSAQGDSLATPRAVAHVALFPEQAAAESAAAALQVDGFTVGVERDDEGEFALTAMRTDPVAPPTVHELSWKVKETVERHGGTYEGWTCAVA